MKILNTVIGKIAERHSGKCAFSCGEREIIELKAVAGGH